MKVKLCIVVAKYYENFAKDLIKGARLLLDRQKKHQFKYDIIYVPGVFEIPFIISRNIKKYNAFIALGCVIKGETPHFDFISKTTFEGLMKLSIENKKPIGNGIITALNKSQALARCGSYNLAENVKRGKGEEAANAVIDVLFKKQNIHSLGFELE